MNVLDIGDENTPITAMIRHYSRLLAFKEDSAYSVQYGTVTNAEGKILPAFYWTQVNKAIGNIAPGQVRLVDNSPYTCLGRASTHGKQQQLFQQPDDRRTAGKAHFRPRVENVAEFRSPAGVLLGRQRPQGMVLHIW